MFSNNFVVAVKVNGKVLREVQDIVYLPFGTEYTILLKNTSPQRAKVKVSIDGNDATEGTILVVDGNDSLELKRSIKNGNFEVGNAFKFIEKTAKIEQHRGNKAEDGLLTVAFEFERKPSPLADWSTVRYRGLGGGCHGYNNLLSNASLQGSTQVSYSATASCASDEAPTATASLTMDWMDAEQERSIVRSKGAVAQNTAGITAPGQIVEQAFRQVADFVTDGVKHSLTLQLKGKTDAAVEVTKPVVVKKVQRCTMCGTNTRQTAKFCHECGASVELV